VASPPPLELLFRRKPVVDLDELRRILGRASRTTVFRALRPLGYLTSYSHAGRYYTLRRIPDFDANGLWRYHDIGFSAQGTLCRTLTHLVDRSPAGHTHEELQALVHLRVFDTLRRLVRAGALEQRTWQKASVYLSARADLARTQWQRREASVTPGTFALDLAQVVDVLIDVIRHPADEAADVARRLRAAGHPVPPEQVEAVFRRYALGKKTPPVPSRPSRR
jgi:hypothetical protein